MGPGLGLRSGVVGSVVFPVQTGNIKTRKREFKPSGLKFFTVYVPGNSFKRGFTPRRLFTTNFAREELVSVRSLSCKVLRPSQVN